jgi:hypothetical protein
MRIDVISIPSLLTFRSWSLRDRYAEILENEAPSADRLGLPADSIRIGDHRDSGGRQSAAIVAEVATLHLNITKLSDSMHLIKLET